MDSVMCVGVCLCNVNVHEGISQKIIREKHGKYLSGKIRIFSNFEIFL